MQTTDEFGRNNIWAKEPQIQVIPEQPMFENQKTYFEKAERANGWAAMLGVIAAIGAYVTTGQLIPGVF